MKKINSKKFLLTCLGIIAPVSLVSAIAASCNNKQINKEDIDKSTENSNKQNGVNTKEDHSKYDHSEHNHSNENKETESSNSDVTTNNLSEDNGSNVSLTSEKVDKLPSSENGVVNIEKVATTSNSIHFSIRFTYQIKPDSEIITILSDNSGKEKAYSFNTKNKRDTKYIDVSIKDLEPLTEYSIKRIVLESKKCAINNETTFETSAKPPRLPVAEGNFVTAYVTNEAYLFNSEANENPTSISYTHSLDMKFENYQKIIGLPMRVSLKLVGSADKHNQNLGDSGETTSNIFYVKEDGTAKVVFPHRSVDWKRKYTISKIYIDYEYWKNQQSKETISISKVFETPIEITSSSGEKYHIEKIDFEQSSVDTDEGILRVTFSEFVPAKERNKIKLLFKNMSQEYKDDGGFSFKSNKGDLKFFSINAYELEYNEPNPLLKINYGDNEYVLTDSQQLIIPEWSAPSEEEIDNKKNELKNLEFGFHPTVELNVGFHPSHKYLPENATASIGPEEKVTPENVSLNEVVYKQYIPMKFISQNSVEGKKNDAEYWFLMSILIDGDPIANLESNIFMTAELENVNEDSPRFHEVKESEMEPVGSNGSARMRYVVGKPSEIEYYALNFHIKKIHVWRKEPEKERVLIKTFEPEKLGLNPLRLGRSHSA